MGNDPHVVNGTLTSLALLADINKFLYDYTYQFESVEVNTIKKYGTNHLIFGPVALGGVGSYGIRPQVIQAISDAHVDAMTPSYDPAIPANISTALLPYEQVGKPVYIWYGSSANADSYWHT